MNIVVGPVEYEFEDLGTNLGIVFGGAEPEFYAVVDTEEFLGKLLSTSERSVEIVSDIARTAIIKRLVIDS